MSPLTRNLKAVAVTVTDYQAGQPVPSHMTVLTDRGEMAHLFHFSNTNTPVRIGRIYTTGRRTRFELPAGSHEFSATRGREWGLARKTVSLAEGTTAVDLRLYAVASVCSCRRPANLNRHASFQPGLPQRRQHPAIPPPMTAVP